MSSEQVVLTINCTLVGARRLHKCAVPIPVYGDAAFGRPRRHPYRKCADYGRLGLLVDATLVAAVAIGYRCLHSERLA
jgi:hypothetical protein